MSKSKLEVCESKLDTCTLVAYHAVTSNKALREDKDSCIVDNINLHKEVSDLQLSNTILNSNKNIWRSTTIVLIGILGSIIILN